MDTVRLFHGTSTAMLDKAARPLVLQPADAHGGARVWQPLPDGPENPADLLYLADEMALVFALEAAGRLGGSPVVVEVEVAATNLLPCPTYVSMIQSIGQEPGDWRASLLACGRIATRLSVPAGDVWTCEETLSLLANVQRAGLDDHRARWMDTNAWRPFASALRVNAQSWADYRNKVGGRIRNQLFART